MRIDLSHRPFAAEIADYLNKCETLHGVTVDTIAADRGIKRRAVQHRLMAEGITFKELLDTERRVKARRVVYANPCVSVPAIARVCGFKSEHHARRSFARWFGLTIREYRALTRGAE